jgi:hypothetical protein
MYLVGRTGIVPALTIGASVGDVSDMGLILIEKADALEYIRV